MVPDGNGSYYPWARCEIEVEDLNDKNVPELPLEVEELILPPELGKLSQEEYDEKTKPIMDRFFTSGNPYVKDGEENSLTELEGEIDEDDEPTEEEKPEEETTGDEVLSVDNITDEKDVADKVETRSEQIVEKREEKEGEDDTEEDNADSETETEDEESSGESEESDNEEKGSDESKGNDEEVTQETRKYLLGLGIDVDVLVSQEGFGAPESITHPETTPAPVEVTQGESDAPSETQQKVEYVPTLNTLVQMSKFQEGHREFEVKSCDEWQ